jgi:hypothetical protein
MDLKFGKLSLDTFFIYVCIFNSRKKKRKMMIWMEVKMVLDLPLLQKMNSRKVMYAQMV